MKRFLNTKAEREINKSIDKNKQIQIAIYSNVEKETKRIINLFDSKEYLDKENPTKGEIENSIFCLINDFLGIKKYSLSINRLDHHNIKITPKNIMYSWGYIPFLEVESFEDEKGNTIILELITFRVSLEKFDSEFFNKNINDFMRNEINFDYELKKQEQEKARTRKIEESKKQEIELKESFINKIKSFDDLKTACKFFCSHFENSENWQGDTEIHKRENEYFHYSYNEMKELFSSVLSDVLIYNIYIDSYDIDLKEVEENKVYIDRELGFLFYRKPNKFILLKDKIKSETYTRKDIENIFNEMKEKGYNYFLHVGVSVYKIDENLKISNIINKEENYSFFEFFRDEKYNWVPDIVFIKTGLKLESKKLKILIGNDEISNYFWELLNQKEQNKLIDYLGHKNKFLYPNKKFDGLNIKTPRDNYSINHILTVFDIVNCFDK